MNLARKLYLTLVPLGLAAVLWFHPDGGPDVFNDVRPDVTTWIAVHTVLLFGFPLMALAAYLLLTGLGSRAATISRVALLPFVAFYTAWETTIGIGNGVLVNYANGLPEGEQAVMSDAIRHYSSNHIVGEESIAVLLGALGWVVSMTAGAVALNQAGAGWPATLLIASSAIFVLHPPPIGPVCLVAFAAGALLVERWRARTSAALEAVPPPPVGSTYAPEH